jgi:prevent-host-death family protein
MSSTQIGIEDARRILGQLVDEACRGNDIVLTRHGKPVARIVPAVTLPVPTLAEQIATVRRFAAVTPVGDTLGLDQRDPAGWSLTHAQVTAEAAPFAALLADIDAFFGDELEAALAGPESTEAEAEVRRIIGENLATVTMRLAMTGAALSQANLTTAPADLQITIARTLLQRAADQRFTELVAPLVAAAPVS